MKTLPTQTENPKGLHQKYYITKIIPNPNYGHVSGVFNNSEPEFILKPIDEGSEYFVLRLDDGGSDPKHIAACRIGVLAYANAIKDHLPELSKDLIESYSSNDSIIHLSQLNLDDNNNHGFGSSMRK